VITLNNPKTKNALNPEMLVRLARIYDDLKSDPNVRVIVLTGTGSCFCSGADLGRLITLMSGARKPEDEWDKAYMSDPTLGAKGSLREFDVGKPIVLAANGHAIAGGMELLQGTDIRVVAEDAKFGLQEPKWGLFPMGGSTVRLPRQIPMAIAMEILLTGGLFSAQRALQFGLVNYVLPKEQVLPKALEIAKQIAENGPVAVKAIKKSVRECIGLPELEAMKKEKELAIPVFAHPDAKEGPRAFLEKRKPVWSKL